MARPRHDLTSPRQGIPSLLYADDVAHEPLPRRWVELIRYLDEQERKSPEPPTACEQASLAEAELAVGNQEKLLRELTCTEEPTEEAAALLEDLRRKVARAVAGRN
jgi:hypothetical protein